MSKRFASHVIAALRVAVYFGAYILCVTFVPDPGWAFIAGSLAMLVNVGLHKIQVDLK